MVKPRMQVLSEDPAQLSQLLAEPRDGGQAKEEDLEDAEGALPLARPWCCHKPMFSGWLQVPLPAGTTSSISCSLPLKK